jgi:hypothetical protein
MPNIPCGVTPRNFRGCELRFALDEPTAHPLAILLSFFNTCESGSDGIIFDAGL